MENKPKKAPCCTALLAHVDAGKTTLSEALLYVSGARRTLGRVDHRDAYLDTCSIVKIQTVAPEAAPVPTEPAVTEPVEATEPAPTEPTPTEPAPTVYTIRINGLVPYYGNGSNEVDTSWKVGETFSLTVEDEMGARKDIQWQIPDETVCSIEGKTVTCLAATKKMLITGEYEGVTYTVTLRISEDTAATEPAEGTE